MAVYTQVSADQIKAFLKGCNLGDYVSHDGIIKGVENSNYHLQTTTGQYILTLVEKRTDPKDVPFVTAFMRHLASQGLPVPNVLAEGVIINKPAIIIEFLAGEDMYCKEITPDHAAQVGSTLADMHLKSESFKGVRTNPVGFPQWQEMFEALKGRMDPGIAEVISNALDACACDEWQKLPRGAVHADLFPDNVFFKDGKLTGLIDFYFSCTSAYVYDLAVTINAWCYGPFYSYPDCLAAFLKAYEAKRPLSDLEREMFPAIRKAAALRFFLTRSYDWCFTPAGANVRKHDPNEYFEKMEVDFAWP